MTNLASYCMIVISSLTRNLIINFPGVDAAPARTRNVSQERPPAGNGGLV